MDATTYLMGTTTPQSYSLSPYQGPWEDLQVAHLLKRTLFGIHPQMVATSKELGLEATLDRLFESQDLPDPPVNYRYEKDSEIPLGTTWVGRPRSDNTNTYKKRSLESWWMMLILRQGMSIIEKMTVFWHNHFATELGIYGRADYGYQYLSLLRENSLGNFKHLVEEITINPAMLRYLNGNQNSEQSPNENYARELFELFTIGKGDTIAEGNYTTYTEGDIQAAARVLTGWRDRGGNQEGDPVQARFFPNRHDRGEKTFSENLGGITIQTDGTGQEEYKELIQLIFDQEATSKYICKKLLTWFLHYELDAEGEEKIIEPLAAQLRDNDYEVEPVLRTLLQSEFFFDPYFRGTQIKNPIDFLFSQLKPLPCLLPEGEDYVVDGVLGEYLFKVTERLQMPLLYPPSVAGWPAYYQQPQQYGLWINAVTLFERNTLPELVKKGFRSRGLTYSFDLIALLEELEDPTDPNAVIRSLACLYLPLELTEDQLTEFKDALIPGLPDYEWSLEYGEYLSNPSDFRQRRSLENKLLAAIEAMLQAPEFHLS